MSPATIASLVFFVFSVIAAAAVDLLGSLLHKFAEEVGINRWIFSMVPALFAMLFALILYQDAQRKIRRLGESVSRGILVMLLTWLSFAMLTSWTWCPPREFGSCLRNAVIVIGWIGGGPMLFVALGAGMLTGVLIIRRPKPRIE
ncbi:MAG TPA: hypothetical protein VGY49_12875 [Burkholderiaceae bacterium]|jgi:hypothetical protein|nr:hypothetical protein [Burkholderiaceae bacterium]